VFAILDGGGKSEKLDRLGNGLEKRGLGGYARIDLGIVRGLAYYTGVVFEAFDRAGKLRALSGGGRYDNLIAQLSDGAASMPAAGFAMGDVVLGDLIAEIPTARGKKETAVCAGQQLDVYVVIAKEERRGDALGQVQELRDNSYRVDFPLVPTKVGKQFQTAESLGARVAVLFGDEWPQAKVKSFATREEVLVPNENVLAAVRQILSS
jgi:histidyl-tRNA synthetase